MSQENRSGHNLIAQEQDTHHEVLNSLVQQDRLTDQLLEMGSMLDELRSFASADDDYSAIIEYADKELTRVETILISSFVSTHETNDDNKNTKKRKRALRDLQKMAIAGDRDFGATIPGGLQIPSSDGLSASKKERAQEAMIIKDRINPAELSNLENAFSRLKIFLEATKNAHGVLEGSNTESTPLQQVGARRLILELKRYTNKPDDVKWRKLIAQYEDFSEKLNIKEAIVKAKDSVEELLIELSFEMAKARTKAAGIFSMIESLHGDLAMRGEELNGLFDELKARSEAVEGEYSHVEEEMRKFLLDLETGGGNNEVRDAKVLEMKEGDWKEVRLKNFNSSMTELNKTIDKLRLFVNPGRTRRELPPASSADRALPARSETSEIEFNGDYETLIAQVKEIFGAENVVGMEEIKNKFGIGLYDPTPAERQTVARLLAEKLNDPQIKSLIERTPKVELGSKFQLVLFPDKFRDGTPITMKSLQEKHAPRMERAGKKLLYEVSWYKNEKFYQDVAPTLSWKLVSKGNLPNTAGKNYFEQTAILRDYLRVNNLAEEDELEECNDMFLNELKIIGNQDQVSTQKVEQICRQYSMVLNEEEKPRDANPGWWVAALFLSKLRVNVYRMAPEETTILHALDRAQLQSAYAWSAQRSS